MSAVVGEWPAWNQCQRDFPEPDFPSNDIIKWLELDIMDHDGHREEEDLAATPRRSRRRQDRLRRQSETDGDNFYHSLNLSGESMGARPRVKRPREIGAHRILQGDSGGFVTTVPTSEERLTGDLISDSDVVDSFIPVNVPSHTSTSEDPDDSPRSPLIYVPNGKIFRINRQGPLNKGLNNNLTICTNLGFPTFSSILDLPTTS